jgi:hypothetical protein
MEPRFKSIDIFCGAKTKKAGIITTPKPIRPQPARNRAMKTG